MPVARSETLASPEHRSLSRNAGGASVWRRRVLLVLVGGLVRHLGHRWRNFDRHVLQYIRAANLVPERFGLLGRIEFDPQEYLVGVIDASEHRVPLGSLLATQRVRVELLLKGVEIPLEHTDQKRHCYLPFVVMETARD
jgi:hypothetical protein